jgi:hypothetical protein
MFSLVSSGCQVNSCYIRLVQVRSGYVRLGHGIFG